ncbi:MAG: hypothetical protein M1548_07670 [Actinobacteria bacterium]|nr:hypothetical protein [Actinomycetota bacterium]
MRLGKTERLIIFILSKSAWVPVKDLIELLGKVKTSESAVRATLFRLKQKGLIVSSRKGRETLFGLSDQGKEFLSSIKIRIAKAEERWDGKWLLLSFNIPEKKRVLRNLLRNKLAMLGFGRLHTNLWISPYDLREECSKIIRELGVEDYVSLFITSYVEEDPKALTYKAWDIENLARTYHKLIPKYAKKLAEFRERTFEDASQAGLVALLQLFELVDEVAELAEKEPMLPRELLPDDWPGFEVKKLLIEYMGALYEKASNVADFDYLTTRLVK